MIVFRFICAILVAWAINWVLARPEAAVLLSEVPEMAIIGPIVGAVAGFINLPRRQGWGLIVAGVNGAWTGVLVIALSSFVFLAREMFNVLSSGLVRDFESFLRILGSESVPLIEAMTNIRLLAMIVGVVVIAALIGEVVSWAFARVRRLRERDDPEPT